MSTIAARLRPRCSWPSVARRRLSWATARCTAARSWVGLVGRARSSSASGREGGSFCGPLDQRPLELAPQVALEGLDLLALERRSLALLLAPADLQPERAPDPLHVDADHARSPRRGARRRRSRAAQRRASHRRGPGRSPAGSPRAAARGRAARRRRSGAPRGSRARAPPPRRRGRSSARRAARRPGGPPATWRSSPPAPRGSRPGRSTATASSAANASRSSEVPTATPSPRSSSQKATMRGARPGGQRRLIRSLRLPEARLAELHSDALGDQVDVRAVLDDDAHRALEHRAVDVVGAEQQQRPRPIDRLGDRGRLLEVELADHVDDLDQPPREPLVELGRVQADDLHLALDLGVVEPQVQAAPLERLGELARVVRGEDDDRVRARLDHAELGNRDLKVREHLEQHRLELLVGLVDLVDQQHHRLGRGDRLEQRAGEQELLGEDVVQLVAGRLLGVAPDADARAAAVLLLGGRGLDPQQLLAVVPLIERLRLVEALVALQADQRATGGARDRLRELGLADPRGALDEDRLAELLGEVGDERRGLVGEIADRLQRLPRLCDRVHAGR